jgi:hypothetical protein
MKANKLVLSDLSGKHESKTCGKMNIVIMGIELR